jgi:hypothetical protein
MEISEEGIKYMNGMTELYCDLITERLSERLPQIEILSKFEIFDPMILKNDSSYGNEKFTQLVFFFLQELNVDPNVALAEWITFKNTFTDNFSVEECLGVSI